MKLSSIRNIANLGTDYDNTIKDLDQLQKKGVLQGIVLKNLTSEGVKKREFLEKKLGKVLNQAKDELFVVETFLEEERANGKEKKNTIKKLRASLNRLEEIGKRLEAMKKVYSLFRNRDKQKLKTPFLRVYYKYLRMVHNQKGWIQLLEEKEEFQEAVPRVIKGVLHYEDFKQVNVTALMQDIGALKKENCTEIFFESKEGQSEKFSLDSSLIDLIEGLKKGKVFARIGKEKVALDQLVAIQK